MYLLVKGSEVVALEAYSVLSLQAVIAAEQDSPPRHGGTPLVPRRWKESSVSHPFGAWLPSEAAKRDASFSI